MLPGKAFVALFLASFYDVNKVGREYEGDAFSFHSELALEVSKNVTKVYVEHLHTTRYQHVLILTTKNWGKAKREATATLCHKSDWGSLDPQLLILHAIDYKCDKIPFPTKPLYGSR